MAITRRDFLKYTAVTGAALYLGIFDLKPIDPDILVLGIIRVFADHHLVVLPRSRRRSRQAVQDSSQPVP